MGFIFKKLNISETVLTEGGMAFKKLSTEVTPPPISGIDPENFDLGIMGLPAGTYTIRVIATAKGLKKSEFSNAVEYTIK